MKRSMLAGLSGIALIAGLALAGSTPAHAVNRNGSQFCGSTQRVFLDTALSAISGGATAATTTRHNHVYGGLDHITDYTGFNVKRSYSGSSSSSTWYVSTISPGTAEFSTLVDGCAAKPA